MTAYRRPLLAVILCAACLAPHGEAAETAPPLDNGLATTVRPFLQAYCFACHGEKKQEAQLDLSGYGSLDTVTKDHHVWKLVLERLEGEEMPPDDAARRPTAEERQSVLAWIRAVRSEDARRHAGDPGAVLARRLSNFEVDCTVRDLTGVDLRPTREFPVDPANEAGFDNSGESLTVSPAWFKKYLAAVRLVADHLVLKPSGFAFAPHAVVSDTDRDKYCVARIVDFYRRHAVDYADYFFLAWQFGHREEQQQPAASLSDIAASAGLSPKYAATVWSTLNDTPCETGPLADLQTMWRRLRADRNDADAARRG
ncbi:MAG TPA: DUF1587 domain-containing protein, partial [Pirellulales bacterium]|nr:DUF1587 domain-containing protein [Pirellulales bacterium]